jgi:hypothetical protein
MIPIDFTPTTPNTPDLTFHIDEDKDQCVFRLQEKGARTQTHALFTSGLAVLGYNATVTLDEAPCIPYGFFSEKKGGLASDSLGTLRLTRGEHTWTAPPSVGHPFVSHAAEVPPFCAENARVPEWRLRDVQQKAGLPLGPLRSHALKKAFVGMLNDPAFQDAEWKTRWDEVMAVTPHAQEALRYARGALIVEAALNEHRRPYRDPGEWAVDAEDAQRLKGASPNTLTSFSAPFLGSAVLSPDLAAEITLKRAFFCDNTSTSTSRLDVSRTRDALTWALTFRPSLLEEAGVWALECVREAVQTSGAPPSRFNLDLSRRRPLRLKACSSGTPPSRLNLDLMRHVPFEGLVSPSRWTQALAQTVKAFFECKNTAFSSSDTVKTLCHEGLRWASDATSALPFDVGLVWNAPSTCEVRLCERRLLAHPEGPQVMARRTIDALSQHPGFLASKAGPLTAWLTHAKVAAHEVPWKAVNDNVYVLLEDRILFNEALQAATLSSLKPLKPLWDEAASLIPEAALMKAQSETFALKVLFSKNDHIPQEAAQTWVRLLEENPPPSAAVIALWDDMAEKARNADDRLSPFDPLGRTLLDSPRLSAALLSTTALIIDPSWAAEQERHALNTLLGNPTPVLSGAKPRY